MSDSSNNSTLDLIRGHRSIRAYRADDVSEGVVTAILEAARMAPSSSNKQAYSVIGVRDRAVKKSLAELAGDQKWIEQAPIFLIWCADLHRIRQACERRGVSMVYQNVENLIVATVDVALAAQNAVIAAESLGLGTVLIGGIRNNPRDVSRLLHLPQLVYPVFGMCVGVPDQDPWLKPRLPLSLVYHPEAYDSGKYASGLEAYDATMSDYYLRRTAGVRKTCWSQEMASKFARPVRTHMRRFLEEQGFSLE